MILGIRTEVSQYEEKILKILGPLNNFFCSMKRLKYPMSFLTVNQLCEVANIDTGTLSLAVKKKLDCVVSQICRAGSRFTKNCICVQMYEDGNNCMKWAMKHGALLCITRSQIEELPCIVVDDPVVTYSQMCKYFRDLSTVAVTAVVGSIGKTTTKRMVSAVYSAQFPTFFDPENENQIDCVGFICQHIPPKSVKQVQEVSEDTPGCIHLISSMLSPEIAIVTAIDRSHIEQLGDENGILNEIRTVTEGMPQNGKVIINIDDDNTKGLITDRETIPVSLMSTDADFWANSIKVTSKGLKFFIVEKATGKQYPILLNHVYAEHNVYSALYAFAAGVCSGVDYRNILKGLDSYHTTGIRQNVYKAGDVLIYADCYNSVSRSVKSAVQAAANIPVTGKKIAVLGDIEEAGDYSQKMHKELIEIVNDSDFDFLLCFGEKLICAAKTAVLRDNLTMVCCETREKMNKEVKNRAKKGDLILFKASRKSTLEETIKTVWPKDYKKKMREYYFPIIKWRMKVIFY